MQMPIWDKAALSHDTEAFIEHLRGCRLKVVAGKSFRSTQMSLPEGSSAASVIAR
jgi:hypothetical protein